MIIYEWLQYFNGDKEIGKIALPEFSDSDLRINLYKHFIKCQNDISNFPPTRVTVLFKQYNEGYNNFIEGYRIDSDKENFKILIDEIKDIDYLEIFKKSQNKI